MLLQRPSATVVLAVIALLAGCAPLNWHKAGATAEARDRDVAECTGEARFAARRQSPVLQSAPRVIVNRQGRTVAVEAPRDDNERFLLEHDLMRDCMRQRGYELQAPDTQTH